MPKLFIGILTLLDTCPTSAYPHLCRFIVFESDATNLVAGDTNNARDIFLRDALKETTTQISINSLGNTANLSSFNPVISADGSFIAFDSFAANLVERDTNNTRNIFVRDRETGIVSLVSADFWKLQFDNSFYICRRTLDRLRLQRD